MMTSVAVPSIDEDIWQDVWDEERAWREEGIDREQMPDPLAMVIFGATGDLAHRKLVPALYSLATSNLLPEKLAVVGFARSWRDEDEFRRGLRDALVAGGLRPRDDVWNRFAGHITYMSGGYDDAASFRRLAETLDNLDQTAGTANHRLFYLAVPPTTYVDVVRNLGAAGLNVPRAEGGWARVIVEKPFGRDLETARALDRCIHEVFDESQVYRIDHYLGKETVQNIFVLRFVNGIFEPLWNRRYVDHVQITVAETLGVENRGGYYEQAGATRDMLQSHMLQLLTLMVDNWRWAGVPFYLRTAKRMPRQVSEIAIQFRRAPHMLLRHGAASRPRQNVLVLRIQPDDGLALRLDVKVPGPGMRVRPVDMSFLYKDAFGGSSPEAYQRLLLDAMRGDSTLFARTDEVEAAWALVTSVLDAWRAQGARELPVYPAGTWGPAEADELLARDGHRWRKP